MVLYGDRTIGTPLHAFWDTEVVKRLGHDPAVVANALDQKFGGSCSQWMTGNPTDWAQESFELARDKAYNLGQQTSDSHGNLAHQLSAQYQAKAIAAAGKQLAKAGCRLAMALNRSVQ
jgi:hypothetical protein